MTEPNKELKNLVKKAKSLIEELDESCTRSYCKRNQVETQQKINDLQKAIEKLENKK